jgi:Ca2+-binding RTX toxin-like protein
VGKDILFIDSRVADSALLIAQLSVNTEIVTLDATQDGLSQMAAALTGRDGLAAIHIISHGAAGTLLLGSTTLTGDNLADYQAQLHDIGLSLTGGGDLLLYGCNVAEGGAGQGFIDSLARWTGVDVAASTGLSGAIAGGGDSVLEASTGHIEAAPLDVGALAPLMLVNGTDGNDSLVGGFSSDTLSGGAGDDSLVGSNGPDTLYGGDGNDKLTLDGHGGLADGGGGNDDIYLQSPVGAWFPGVVARGGDGIDHIFVSPAFDAAAPAMLVDGGAGNDLIEVALWPAAAGVGVTGGGGGDIIAMMSGFQGAAFTIADFSAGAGGDQLDVGLLLQDSMALGYEGGNPFASGLVRLMQSGADTLLQWDADGSGSGGQFLTVAILKNVSAAAMTADNFVGAIAPDGSAMAALQLDGGAGSNLLVGGYLNDTITGGGSDDVLYGRSGDDSIVGGDEVHGDMISGGAGNDTLLGGGGRDSLSGGDGNDSLDGGSGADVLSGDGGNDTLSGGGGNDTLSGGYGVNLLDGGAGDDALSASGGNETLLGGDGNDQFMVVSSGASIVRADGGAGDDRFVMGVHDTGNNVAVSGGAGVDTYTGYLNAVFGTFTINDFAAGAGGDRIDLADLLSYSTYFGGYEGGNPFAAASAYVRLVQDGANTLLQYDVDGTGTRYGYSTWVTLKDTSAGQLTAENFVAAIAPDGAPVKGSQLSGVTVVGGNFDDTILGAADNFDSLQGAGGNDLIDARLSRSSVADGGGGDDTLLGGAGSDWFKGGFGNGNDSLDGGAGNDNLDGGAGNDKLDGGADNDTLNGGSGADTLLGGDGNDSLTISTAVGHGIADGGAGNDSFFISNYNAGGQLDITGGAGSDIFNPASDTVSFKVTDFTAGGGGDAIDLSSLITGYTYTGFKGGDLFALGYLRLVQSGADTLLQSDADGAAGKASAWSTVMVLQNVTASQVTTDNFKGSSGTESFYDDIRYAGPGNDYLYGSWGNDLLDGGNGDDSLLGWDGNDTLIGGAGNDTLVGDAGKDSLAGGAGDDWYRLESDQAVIVEKAGEGNDTIQFQYRYVPGPYTLADNIENAVIDFATMRLNGNAANNLLVAKSDNATLAGNAGNDTLVGSGTSGELIGGTGDDVYRLTSGYYLVTEAAGGGTDRAEVMSGYAALASNVENLRLIGSGALTGVGNALNNVIEGGGGNDDLDGMAGNDTLIGGAGDDRYTVDASGDVVVELAGQGNDLVRTSLAAYTLGATLERLEFTGATAFAGTGNALDNTISGGVANDVLSGLSGADKLSGGDGNDTLLGGDGADTLAAGAGADSVDGGNGDDTLILDGEFSDYLRLRIDATTVKLVNNLTGDTVVVKSVEQFVFAGQAKTLTEVTLNIAGQGNDALGGGGGNDTLDGGAGIDTLTGGLGDDVYVVDVAADKVVEAAGEGMDSVSVAFTAAGTYVMTANVENASVTAAESIAANITGNELANILTGNAAANTLTGGAGDDTLDGGAGADKLAGGTGNDVYMVADAGDVVTENAGEGIDYVRTSLASYALTANAEHLSYTGAAAFTGTGNALDNIIVGGSGGNKLDGGAGNDELTGGSGVDSLQGGLGNDTFFGATGKDTIDGGDGSDELRGLGNLGDYAISRPNATDTQLTDKAGNVITVRNVESFQFDGVTRSLDDLQYNIISVGSDKLYGTNDDDTLDGGLGADTLNGGAGDDTYIIDNAGDTLVEGVGPGKDTAQVGLATAGATYTLAENVENGKVSSTAAINLTGNADNNALTGNAAANTLTGGAGDDTLDGGAGADKLVGGTGEDVYIVADAGAVVTENADEGWDTVRTSLASYTMTANVEVLAYAGAAAFTGTGNAQDNFITGGNVGNKLDGGAGDDTLRGGHGNDSLLGGLGNDQLTGGAGKDTIDGGAGSDTVMLNGWLGDYTITRPSTTDTVLTDSLGNSVTLRNVEFVQAAGAPYSIQQVQLNIASPGADHLIGGADNDTMTGGTGIDTLEGGAGDDTYVIADKASQVIENPYEGVDLVQVAFATAGTYVLSANVENATVVSAASVAVNLTGNNGDNLLTGNAAANTLTGNAGNDTLDGAAGADKLAGGAGDDTYVVADSGDVVAEALGEGRDMVQTTLAGYTLGVNVEDLAYKGNGAFTGTGNALDNEIRGGDHGAKLDGGAGNDLLYGGTGKDSLQGGTGDDLIFAADGGADTIDGGAGSDTAVVAGIALDYTVTRISGTDTQLTDSHGNVVTLRNVEMVEFNGQSTGLTIGELVFNLPSSGGDHLYGYNGDDMLDGGAGIDTLEGGAGDDTYVIANTASVVKEDDGAGHDTVLVALTAAGTYQLAEHVEDAYVTAAASVAVNLTGNELDNFMSGNAASNTLIGGAGDDTLAGGLGNDVLKGGTGNDSYGVMDSGDTVTELAGEGMDRVVTTLAAYTLGANLEILDYAGTAMFTGTGNALSNLIMAGNGGSRLDGGGGDDVLAGGSGSGNDSMLGGAGDDAFFAGAGKDTVDGGTGDDVLMSLDYFENYTVIRPNATDTVLTHYSGATITLRNIDYLEFAGGELTLAQAQVNSASPGADTLYGSEYDDALDGGLGNDVMVGGDGDDDYTLSAPGDIVVEAPGAGHDAALLAFAAAGSYTMAANVEDAVMTAASTVAVNVIGNGLDNYIAGNAGANKLSGGAGNDVLVGGAGIDTMLGGDGDDQYTVAESGDVVTENAGEGYDTVFSKAAVYAMGANVEDMVFIGGGAFTGTGGGGDNRLFAGSSSGAKLDGGAGNDRLVGGAGNDSLIGGLGDDLIQASAGKDTVDGGADFDALYSLGAFGNYVVSRPNATDTLLTDAQGVAITVRGVEYFFFDGVGMSLAQVQNNSAGIGNNVITGTTGNDVLDGGVGVDTLVGGQGDDVYIVDNAADVITENAGEGYDQVKVTLASGTYVMAAEVEDAAVTSSGAVNVTGNVLSNYIIGNAAANKLLGGDGDDTLDGGAGSDALTGGLGDDVYLIGETGDVAAELAGQGYDRVAVKAAAYTLGANIEDMTYTGSGAFTGTGNVLDNVIAGGDGGAKLDGGGGSDTLEGGAGNDSLVGGSGDDELRGSAGTDILDGGAGYDGARMAGMIGDYVIMRPNATDMVLTDRAGNVTTLRNVEYLYFADTDLPTSQLADNVATTGNDALRGTGGNDTINGLAGNDSMTGGLGDDLYIVSTAGDVIVEHDAEGLDHANVAFTAAGTYVLADNLENATVTAAAGVAVNLTGNALDNALTGNAAANTLVGNAGNDTLNGGAGGDSMVGGEGDDYYVVDAAGDKVVETAGNGTDRVDTSLASYTLAANVENLRYTGASAFTGTGNELANTIQSGAGNDVLSGGAGDDVLNGGAGSDKLAGGAGADIFVLNSLVGSDTITDFVSGTDHLNLGLAALAIGNGDMVLDGAVTRAAAGGFAADAELVLFTQRMASASTANAATVIGSATSGYAVGDTALFAVSTSTATTLYRFTSSGTDAVISAAELTQLVVLTGTPTTELADYLV